MKFMKFIRCQFTVDKNELQSAVVLNSIQQDYLLVGVAKNSHQSDVRIQIHSLGRTQRVANSEPAD